MTYIGETRKIVQVEPLWLPGQPKNEPAEPTEAVATPATEETTADVPAEDRLAMHVRE